MAINKELLKGSTVILVLTLLSRRDMYGYEIVKELGLLSEGVFELKEGTLYPILHTLEAERWVDAYWQEHDGRRRKYYRLTEEGRGRLKEKKAEWVVFRSAVDGVIGEGGIG